MIYVDSSAMIKLIHPEPESKVLSNWLAERVDQGVFSSALIEVETHRAIRRFAPERIPVIAPFLAEVDRIEMDVAIRGVAAAFFDRHL
ncbi:PIN domain-containing protein, partial [Sphaerimonospora thailandensis]|uniref:PIN domain-containing protein n=1 Tax=Sphaerimonospora thailandensis TaxID=795644 RepID=UPI00194F6248